MAEGDPQLSKGTSPRGERVTPRRWKGYPEVAKGHFQVAEGILPGGGRASAGGGTTQSVKYLRGNRANDTIDERVQILGEREATQRETYRNERNLNRMRLHHNQPSIPIRIHEPQWWVTRELQVLGERGATEQTYHNEHNLKRAGRDYARTKRSKGVSSVVGFRTTQYTSFACSRRIRSYTTDISQRAQSTETTVRSRRIKHSEYNTRATSHMGSIRATEYTFY